MLRKEEILERTSNGLAIFKHYLPGNWRIGRNFLNPLYEDSKASCNIYFDRRSSIYKMKDFGNDSYSGDCFFLVGQLKGLDCNRAADFVEILEIIDRDLGLGLASGTPVSIPPATVHRTVSGKTEETPEKPVKPYQFREQKFPLAELVYWQQYGITGGEGTGKSNYVAAIVAGCICPAGAEVDTLGIQITANGRHKAVLLYDTEQSEVQLFKNVSNLLARAKQPDKPDELKAFCLTGMSRKERLNAIVQSMDKFYYQYGGIQLVVIDGIADLVKSANDEAESVAVIDELYRLAGIYNTCILCVLHFVPNGLKLRGHLGSELQRKAATILSIEKDEEPTQSVVKALKVREGSPLDVPLMLFAWDKKAGMHVYKGEKPREEKEKRKERELVNVARDIFGRQTRITYIDLCEQLQQVLDIKERTAKSYIRFMRERDIITKDTANQSCFIIGSYNLQRNASCP
ncbi:AAA family ATPase [Bacteroides fragilis]|uniref:AAA domain protein n=1 Tax=Bacteroides fragilis str. 3988T(B)14 TaxID=1339315 RepID=A0A015TW82_BACFG|nr:AAA family ATPase [Bacteroides fragilis]EXY75036.1 AAA domain protein [Bacteroides fragilis str. 3988T(B)14]EXY81079.1 AAA domain protein [Bacteroides fragilis str. 3988 T1]